MVIPSGRSLFLVSGRSPPIYIPPSLWSQNRTNPSAIYGPLSFAIKVSHYRSLSHKASKKETP